MMSKKAIAYIITGCIFANSLTFSGVLASGEEAEDKKTTPAADVSVSKPLQKLKPVTTPETSPLLAAADVFAGPPGTATNEEPEIFPDSESTPCPTAEPASTAAPQITPDPEPSPTPVIAPASGTSEEESLWYREKLPMKKEHQKLLWDYCKERKLDYMDMLALISTESNFNEKASSGSYKGYFQISTSNAANLSKTLKTLNKPLDGAININWGTAMYSWILADKRCKGTEDAKKKRDIALSIYSRGTGGYDKYGLNTNFLKRYYKMHKNVCAYFE